jgi:hypothetical protein
MVRAFFWLSPSATTVLDRLAALVQVDQALVVAGRS